MGEYQKTDIIRHLAPQAKALESLLLSTPRGSGCDLKRHDYGGTLPNVL